MGDDRRQPAAAHPLRLFPRHRFRACNKREPGSGCPAIHGENRLHAILGGSEHCIATHPSDLRGRAGRARRHGRAARRRRRQRTVPIDDFYLAARRHAAARDRAAAGRADHRDRWCRPAAAARALALSEGARPRELRVRAGLGRGRAGGRRTARSATARIALGGVGTKPWRLPEVEAALAGTAVDPRRASTAAAAHAGEGAQPLAQNGFKLTLMQRAVLRALQTVTA